MSVRQSLLAILDQGPCYGYQLRAEFDRRTGSAWPLNVGQIYNTLDRLERDGLVTQGGIGEQGQVYYRITEAGSAEVAAWLASPADRGVGARNDLAIKIAVAATLPGVDAARVIGAQRAASVARLEELTAQDVQVPPDAEALASAMIRDAMILAADAEVRWLDRAAERLIARGDRPTALPLSTDRPKRGRPAAASASADDRSILAPPRQRPLL